MFISDFENVDFLEKNGSLMVKVGKDNDNNIFINEFGDYLIEHSDLLFDYDSSNLKMIDIIINQNLLESLKEFKKSIKILVN